MKFVFAPDSFKGSLTAAEICDILETCAKRVFPDAETVSVPVADGGEGTADAFLRAMGGTLMHTKVTGPLFEKTTAEWVLLPDGRTAVLEAARACGLPLVPKDERDPEMTTSMGVGELIAAALKAGARHLLIGLGGSSTNDGGIGMLSALGAAFTSREGRSIMPVGGELINTAKADFSGLLPALSETDITVFCDVTNPLLGPEGASYVYGPQKGGTPDALDRLEEGMAHYAALVSEALGRDISSFAGAGAAGGLGAALGGVLGAQMKSGVEAVLDAVNFDEKLEGASLAVSGEGRVDSTSVRFGKVLSGVAARCRAKGIPLAVLTGSIGEGSEELYEMCESTVMAIASGPISRDESMSNARALLESAAERLFRAIKIGARLA